MFPDNAITGSSLAALLAGSKPKTTPETKATKRETNDAHSGGRKLKVGKSLYNLKIATIIKKLNLMSSNVIGMIFQKLISYISFKRNL